MKSLLHIDEIYSVSRSVLGPGAWDLLLSKCSEFASPDTLGNGVRSLSADSLLPDFLPDLIYIEFVKHQLSLREIPDPVKRDSFELNPALEIIPLKWILSPLFKSDTKEEKSIPVPGEERLLIWKHPVTGQVRIASAGDEDLLALKLVSEEIPLKKTVSPLITEGRLYHLLHKAARKGILLAPVSRIRRNPSFFKIPENFPERFLDVSVFTLQWHITQACDLNCKHCYDRSKRSPMTLKQGLAVLDDFLIFCMDRRVQGHVCFTGGNPLIYPHFLKLYKAASQKGFSTTILGNPAPGKQIEELAAIQKPAYFQVSLEGLREHNDAIRGEGNYLRVLEFLGVLRDCGVSPAVMLTLTRDNIDQILPLAEKLRGHADRFTFNRLSLVGEGASLHLPSKEKFVTFLRDYTDASRNHSIIGIKDNLINILHHEKGMSLFGGCTGFGCGAAFSFLALLPDGQVHACRKFPSLLGNIFKQSLSDIYDTKEAQKYRKGSEACGECALRPVCGGCLSITHSFGLDVFKERDPFCFLDR